MFFISCNLKKISFVSLQKPTPLTSEGLGSLASSKSGMQFHTFCVSGGQLGESLKVLPAGSGCAATDVPQPVVQQKTKLIIEELNLQKEGANSIFLL